MEQEKQQEEKQLTAVQRAKKKYALKNKGKFQGIISKWNKEHYETDPVYREMVKKCSNNYYHTHKEEIRAKARAKRLLTQQKLASQ